MALKVTEAAQDFQRQTDINGTDLNVTGGVIVHGIWLNNTSGVARTVTIANADESVTIADVPLDASGEGSRRLWNLPFRRRDGVNVTADAGSVEGVLFTTPEQ